MGWTDREYMRADSHAPLWRLGTSSPATSALIIAHIAALLLVAMMQVDAGRTWLEFITLSGTSLHWPAVVLHPFSTASFWTVLFVGWVLWTLGRLIEARIGSTRLVLAYFGFNTLAGAVFYLVAMLRPAWASAVLTVPLGALVAAIVWVWTRMPDERVGVFGMILPVAPFVAALGGIGVLSLALSAGSGAAAFLLAGSASGGAVFALAGVRVNPLPRLHNLRLRASATSQRGATPGDDDIDDLLEKISRHGLQSLTSAERRRLERARQERLRRMR